MAARKAGARLHRANLREVVHLILAEVPGAHIPKQISEISLLFTNDAKIRSLNAQYRGKDKATDVLSFSHIEGLTLLSLDSSLGDIVISTDTARRQARQYRVTLNAEILRLLIHGILHLFGYDHEGVSARKAQQMRRTEARIMKRLSSHRLRLLTPL